MTETSASVAIVVDPDFVELSSLAEQMPVWIADTPANRSRAESVWSRRNSRQPTLTTFRVAGDDTAAWCQTILPQVELHHGRYSQSPAYNSIEVFGVNATPNLRAAFSDYGFTISTERTDGFRAVR